MTDIKEALAALDEWEPNGDRELNAHQFLRETLQSVAQEREDWRAIEAAVSGERVSIGSAMGRVTGRMIAGDSFAEALSKAATWARAEMTK